LAFETDSFEPLRKNIGKQNVFKDDIMPRMKLQYKHTHKYNKLKALNEFDSV